MATTLTSATAQAACDAIVNLLDSGGTLEIQNSSNTVLVEFTLGTPAFGAATLASPSVATANSISQANPSAGGTADHFVVKNSGGTEVWRGTVTATGGGGDMTLGSTTISLGVPVTINTWTFSHRTVDA